MFCNENNQLLEHMYGQGTQAGPQLRGARGWPFSQTKISPPQTAHNSANYAKFFPLRQFEDVGSMTFFYC